jgi:periplasmic copper chaperone A
VKLPDAAGTTLYFPTLQTCEAGKTDWSDIAKDGQDPHSLKAPAPSVTVTQAADAGGHGTDHAAAATDGGTDGNADGGAGGGADARSWAGLAAGVGGLVLGGTAFVRSTARRPKAAGSPAR